MDMRRSRSLPTMGIRRTHLGRGLVRAVRMQHHGTLEINWRHSVPTEAEALRGAAAAPERVGRCDADMCVV